MASAAEGGVQLNQEPQAPRNTEVETERAPETTEENDDDIEDLFEGSDGEDIVPELLSADGNDYTKAYNRQRKLNDKALPPDHKPKSNPQKPSANTSAAIDDQVASLAKHAGKIRLTGKMSGATGGAARDKDKADRATTEQVLDRRTQMILLQLINRDTISEIHGVISTGKEANVYHAISEPTGEETDPIHRAVKVYKTSILVFKDRAKYVEGEFRFRQGYNKSNNRAMVKLWADKERRNLARIHDAGASARRTSHPRSCYGVHRRSKGQVCTAVEGCAVRWPVKRRGGREVDRAVRADAGIHPHPVPDVQAGPRRPERI
jgi:RIO kinase 1